MNQGWPKSGSPCNPALGPQKHSGSMSVELICHPARARCGRSAPARTVTFNHISPQKIGRAMRLQSASSRISVWVRLAIVDFCFAGNERERTQLGDRQR
jgi:hypothetical protein